MKRIKGKDVNKFIQNHESFYDGINISDTEIVNRFNPKPNQMKGIKQKFYQFYTIGYGQLVDYLDKYENFLVALKKIRVQGFGIPLRVTGWGYKEPKDIDELEDYLKKNESRWQLYADNASDKRVSISEHKSIIQKKLIENE